MAVTGVNKGLKLSENDIKTLQDDFKKAGNKIAELDKTVAISSVVVSNLNDKLSEYLESSEGRFTEIFQYIKNSMVINKDHSNRLNSIKTEVENKLEIHKKEVENRSLKVKIYMILRDGAAFAAVSLIVKDHVGELLKKLF